MSTREQVLDALQAVLETALGAAPAGPVEGRNLKLLGRIPTVGLVILRDGDPGDPETTLSPLTYHFEHRATIDVLVDGAHYATEAARDVAFAALLAALGAAVVADRTLGGLCDWIEPQAPEIVHERIEGAEALKAAGIAIALHYATTDPLG
jgi:hypothetical protein